MKKQKKGSINSQQQSDNKLKLNLSFEQAMKKALNTPLPKNPKKKK